MKVDKFNFAWLSLTYECNNRCKWCYTNSNNYKLVKDKTFDYKKEEGTINLLKELGIKKVTLIGGEPTLYPNIGNLINKIKLKGMACGIVSNGRKFNDKGFVHNDVIKILDKGLNGTLIYIKFKEPQQDLNIYPYIE